MRGIIIWIRSIRRGGIILSHGGRVIGYWSLRYIIILKGGIGKSRKQYFGK